MFLYIYIYYIYVRMYIFIQLYVGKNTIMHLHMWGSLLKSMTKSNFFKFWAQFCLSPFCLWPCPQKTSLRVFRNLHIFQSFEGGRKSVPEQVIQQPHIGLLHCEQQLLLCHDGRHFLLLINSIGGSGYIIRAAHCFQPWGRSSTVAGYTC